MRPRLVAIDLDGTLLREDRTLSERSRAALRVTQRAGIIVTVVSARGPRVVREVVSATELDGAAICSNGAIVIDLPSGAIRRLRAFDSELSHEPGFSAWGWTPPAGTRVADAVALLDQPATKLIARHPGHELDVLAATVEEVAGEAAFGDHLNDVPMLARAGHSVAVANAHPEVAAAAAEMTASNEDDGVAIVLERLVT